MTCRHAANELIRSRSGMHCNPFFRRTASQDSHYFITLAVIISQADKIQMSSKTEEKSSTKENVKVALEALEG